MESKMKKDSEDTDKKALRDKLADAEKRLVALARECNLATAHASQMKELCTKNGIEVDEVVSSDTTLGLQAMEELLIAKNNEVESILVVVASQERALELERISRGHAEAQVHTLTRRLNDNAIELPASPPPPQVPAGVDIKSFMAFVRAARDTSAKATHLGLGATGAQISAEITQALSDKDSQIVEHETELLEGRSTIAQMAALIAELTSQIEESGSAVARPLTSELQAALAKEKERLSESAAETAKALEEKVKRHQEEKDRLQSILNSMAEDRSKEMRGYLERQKELEDKLEERERSTRLETDSGENSSLFDVISTLKQKVADRDDELKRITHELMKCQAEMCKESGFFSKVKSKFN
jgi:NADH dehydrogenase/NADH:ubiquinone oxidoreductase subunit G